MTKTEEALAQVGDLLAALDALPETRARDIARDLVKSVLDLHCLALARITSTLAMNHEGRALLDAFAADDLIAAVLLLHGLHPESLEARVQRALAVHSPHLRTQGAEVQLMEVDDGVARLRLRAPGASREQTAMLRRELERALTEAAPDLEEIAVLNEVEAVLAQA